MIATTLRNKPWIALIAFIALGLALYFPSLKGEFLLNFDDEKLILNSTIEQGLNWQAFQTLFSEFVFGLYHPITSLTWLIESEIFGFDPFYFQLDNILLHAINAFLVFLFIGRLLSNKGIAIFSGLLFLVHPMYVENISWLSSRKDLVYGLFFLGGLASYLKYHSTHELKWFAVSCLLFILSLFSKSAAIVFPAILLLLDWYLGSGSWKKKVLQKIPLFILSGIFVYITIKSQESAGFIKSFTGDYSLVDRFVMTSYSAANYLFKLLLPLELSPKNLYPVKENGWLPAIYYASLILWAGIAFLFYKNAKSEPLYVFALLFFIIIIRPTLKFIPTGNDLISNRYAYLPYIVLFAFVVKTVLESKKSWLTIIAIFWVGFLIGKTVGYQEVYLNSINLWTKVVEEVAENDAAGKAMALNERGSVHYKLGRQNLAFNDIQQAIQLSQALPRTFMNRGKIYQDRGQLELALKDFNQAVVLSESDPEALKLRAVAYAQNNQAQLAIEDLGLALQSHPNNVEYLNNRGIAYSMLQNYGLAEADFSRAIEIQPGFLDAYVNRANLNIQQGKPKQAQEDLAIAYANQTNNPTYIYLIAKTHLMLDQPEKAKAFLAPFAKNELSAAQIGGKLFADGYAEESLAYFNIALGNPTVREKVLYQRAQVFASLEQYQNAIDDLLAILEKMPNGQFFFEIAMNYQQLGNMEKACEFWNEGAIRKHKPSVKALSENCK